MIKLSVNINEFGNDGRKIAGITIDFKDFLTLKNVAGLLEEKQASTQEIDLSKVEQGALIKELLKREGVNNLISKANQPFNIMADTDTGTGYGNGVRGIGPANIIIVMNKGVEK